MPVVPFCLFPLMLPNFFDNFPQLRREKVEGGWDPAINLTQATCCAKYDMLQSVIDGRMVFQAVEI